MGKPEFLKLLKVYIYFDRFSHTEHTHVTSIQTMKQNFTSTLKLPSYLLPVISLLPLKSLTSNNKIAFLAFVIYVKVIIQSRTFCVWPFPLNITSRKFIHVTVCR